MQIVDNLSANKQVFDLLSQTFCDNLCDQYFSSFVWDVDFSIMHYLPLVVVRTLTLTLSLSLFLSWIDSGTLAGGKFLSWHALVSLHFIFRCPEQTMLKTYFQISGVQMHSFVFMVSATTCCTSRHIILNVIHRNESCWWCRSQCTFV